MASEVREYTLKLSTKEAQANVDELNKSLKLQEDLIEDIEADVRKYQKQLNKTSKTDLAARQDLNDKIKKTKERLIDEKIALKSVNKDRKKANETLKESTANAKDYSGVLGIIDQKTGGAISGFTNLTKTVGGATKGFNFLKIAIIGTGIGALLIAITAVTAAFTSSEEGQNKFAKILAVVGSVVGNLVTMLSDLGEGIISVFENPKQAIIDLKNLIVENITNRITSLIDTFGFLGSAIKKVFSGDFAGAMDDAKSAGSSYIDTMTGVKDTINKVSGAVKGLVEEIVKEGKIAAGIADQRATADKLERNLLVERAKANRDRADLLEKAVNKEDYNLTKRIGFLKEAGKIEDEITAKEITAAELRLSAKVSENALANSTKEDLLEEATLRANLINLETAKLTKAKEVTGQIIALNAEAVATKLSADTQAKMDAQSLQDFKDGLIQKDKDNKYLAAEEEKAQRLKELEELKISETEKQQLIVDIDNSFKERKKEIDDEAKILADEKLAAFLESELEKKELNLEEQKQAALDEVERLGGTEEAKDKIRKKYAKEEKKIEGIKRDANIDMAQQTFAGIATLLGENSKAGKAAAVAAALINTYQGITAELATKTVTPYEIGFKIANVAMIAAVGFKSVKSILATKPTEGGSPATTNPASGVSSPTPPQPPSFNVVGQSDTNQLADAIGGQEQQPVQAYVVSSDVTSAQELDRNIIDGASI